MPIMSPGSHQFVKEHTDTHVCIALFVDCADLNIKISDKASVFDVRPWWEKWPFKAVILRKSPFGHL